MGVIFQDGCDLYGTDELKADQSGWIRTTNTNCDPTLGRFGGGCLCCQYNTNYWSYPLVVPKTTLWIHGAFWYQSGEVVSSSYGILYVTNATGQLVAKLFVNAVSHYLEIWDANNVLQATSTWAVTPDIWHALQTKIVVHATTGSIEVYRGASSVVATNIDTLPSSGAGSIGVVRYGQVVHRDWNDNRWDDVAIWDDSGSDWNTWTEGKDLRIDTLRANAEGTPNDFTPIGAGDNFAEVDETPDHDADTSYNASSNVGNKDRLGLSTLADTPVEIYNVRTRVWAKKTNAGASDIKIGVYSGATEGMSAAKGLQTEYDHFTHDEEINPDDSLPWEIADIDALQVEYEHA